MLVQNNETQLFALPVDSNVGFKVVDQSKLYLVLSNMDDFTRTTTINKMNNDAGFELVNYKLLVQLYKDVEGDTNTLKLTNKISVTERDYIKSYMKLLSK
mgnify:CR=1 FL=1